MNEASLAGAAGIIYCNNVVWESNIILALEKLILENVVGGSCIISTRQLFLSKRGSGLRSLQEESETLEMATNCPGPFEFYILSPCKIGIKRPGKMLQIASSLLHSFDEHLPLLS